MKDPEVFYRWLGQGLCNRVTSGVSATVVPENAETPCTDQLGEVVSQRALSNWNCRGNLHRQIGTALTGI